MAALPFPARSDVLQFTFLTVLEQHYTATPIPKLAAHYGCHPATLRRYANRHGCRRAEYTARDVARGVGCSVNTVVRWIARHQLAGRRITAATQRPRYSISDDALLTFFRDEGRRHLWQRFAGDAAWIAGFRDDPPPGYHSPRRPTQADLSVGAP